VVGRLRVKELGRSLVIVRVKDEVGSFAVGR